MFSHQLGNTVIDVRPDRIRRNGTQFIVWHFDCKIHLPFMAHVDNRTQG